MTIATACAWSLARSLLIPLLAWPICRMQTDWLRQMPDRRRRIMWWLVVIPFLCPELWTGYAWSGFAVRLAGSGFWERLPFAWVTNPQSIVFRDALVDEFLLDLLLFARMIPVGTLALYFAPPPRLSLAAFHCWKLTGHKSVGRYHFWFERHGYLWPVFALMFLVAFQEFELASLIGRPAWTVWLFDAQVGGLALSESLKKTVWPVVCQLAVVIPLTAWVFRNRSRLNTGEHEFRLLRWGSRLIAGVAIGAGFAMLIVVPTLNVGRDTIGGLGRIFQSPLQSRTLFSEIGWGMGYSSVAAVLAMLIAAVLWRGVRNSRWGTAGLCLFSFPGLIGPLVSGLALIRLLQEPILRTVYKTPASFTMGMVLFLLPRACLLRGLLQNSSQPAQTHLARLLANSPAQAVRGAAGELLWRLKWRGEFWGSAVLAYWAFFDLTTAALLAPVTVVSAPVMLYNQMHFGKNATLSALVLLTVLVPLGIFAVAGWSRRFLYNWFWR